MIKEKLGDRLDGWIQAALPFLFRRPMNPNFLTVTGALVSLVALSALPSSASGQSYFGRNKVHFDDFDFQILETDHFDIHFYPEEAEAVEDRLLDAGVLQSSCGASAPCQGQDRSSRESGHPDPTQPQPVPPAHRFRTHHIFTASFPPTAPWGYGRHPEAHF